MRFRRRATRCLLRSAVAGLREIHIFRRERQRLPVEPAFERAGDIFFGLFFQPPEGAVGLLKIGVSIVTRQAEQKRRAKSACRLILKLGRTPDQS